MVKFVFVGNPERKMVRDKETGAARTFKADREEPDSFKMVTRDGQKAYVFMKDHATEVDDERMIKTLRGNSHFRELRKDGKTEVQVPVRCAEPEVIMPDGVSKEELVVDAQADQQPAKDDRGDLFR